jgi:ribosomal protein S12 methylthiotransferase
LERLDDLPGPAWLRLLYAHPHRVDDLLLQTMAQGRKIVPYLDVPLQHCVPGILTAMHRSADVFDYETLVERIRDLVPGIALRTSLMVGFPGETEDDFEQLLRFVERVQFDYLGVFAFSPEPGSRAAKFSGQQDEEVKTKRRNMVMELQRDISRRRLERLIGQKCPVLVEGFHEETELLLAGRLATQAPEVDGITLITRGMASAGQIREVTITGVADYDVIGELAVSRLAVNGGNYFLKSTDVGRVTVEDFHLPIALLGITHIHAEQVRGEQCGFLAASAGSDLNDHILIIIGVFRGQHQFKVSLDFLQPFS